MKTLGKLFILFVCVSCQSATSDTSGNEATARALFEAFNRHDWAAMAEYYREPAQFLDPSYGLSYVSKTRKETADKYAEMTKTFRDLHDEVVGVYASGDKVTVEFVSTGTAPDSSKFTLPIISVLTFKDGLIVKDATYYDNP